MPIFFFGCIIDEEDKSKIETINIFRKCEEKLKKCGFLLNNVESPQDITADLNAEIRNTIQYPLTILETLEKYSENEYFLSRRNTYLQKLQTFLNATSGEEIE